MNRTPTRTPYKTNAEIARELGLTTSAFYRYCHQRLDRKLPRTLLDLSWQKYVYEHFHWPATVDKALYRDVSLPKRDLYCSDYVSCLYTADGIYVLSI